MNHFMARELMLAYRAGQMDKVDRLLDAYNGVVVPAMEACCNEKLQEECTIRKGQIELMRIAGTIPNTPWWGRITGRWMDSRCSRRHYWWAVEDACGAWTYKLCAICDGPNGLTIHGKA